ncbi:MAG: hypothetical protein ACAH80_14955 [Alphaproteobacteria bacterium]
MSDKPTKYFIRFSSKEDSDKIVEFYDLNAHKNVRKRQQELMKQLVDDGAVVIIEDEKGKIVAASITYPHTATDEKGNEVVKWQEMGTTRITLNGYPGLFDALITMQTLRAFLVEPPTSTFVAQMHTAPVQGLASNLGWRPMDKLPEGLMDSKIKTMDPADVPKLTEVNWFLCGTEALPVMAARMVKSVENPVLENKKTGEKIELDYSKSTFFKLFGDEIKALAGKDFGDVDKPNVKQNVQRRRDRWLKDFFR